MAIFCANYFYIYIMPLKNDAAPYLTLKLKNAGKACVVLLIILLTTSVYYFKERMLFIDAPHILFRIVNDAHLQITDFRYGSFITQVFPLVAARLHLPLSGLMIIYSASFYLFFIAVLLLLVYKFRNYGLTVLFGLYLTLFVSDTFFWPNNEIHQGIAWLLLAFALNFSIATKKTHLLLAIPIFILSYFLAIWTHPLVMLIAIYLWGFFIIDGSLWPYPRKQTMLYSVILLVLAYCKFHQGQHHGYDSGKIEVVTLFQAQKLKTIFSAPQFHFFIKGCVTNYWLLILISVAGLIGVIKEKKYLLLVWVAAFGTGYLLLLTITYWDVQSTRFYMESEYMPLSIICAAPFVYCVLPKLNSRTGVALLALVFCIRLGYIHHAAEKFSARIALLESIRTKMKEKGLHKIVITNAGTADSTLIMNWGAPVESMLLSGLKHETPQSTFIFLDSTQMKTFSTTSKDTLLGCFEKRAANQLNSRYFQLDTTISYQTISFAELMK